MNSKAVKAIKIEEEIEEENNEEQEIDDLLTLLKKKQQELDKKLHALCSINTKE